MCSQNESVACVAVDGMLVCCRMLSVCAEPYPSSHAFHAPVCGASNVELSMTCGVTVHGAGFADPFSNPELPSSCIVVFAAVTVKLIVTVWVCPPPVQLTTIG